MGILFLCKNCETPLNIKVRLAGKRAYCPKCEHKLVIPESSEITESEYKRRQRELTAADQQAYRDEDPPAPDLTANDACEQTTIEKDAEATAASEPAAPKITDSLNHEPAEPVESQSSTVAPAAIPMTHFVASPPGTRSNEKDPFADNDKSVWYVRPPTGGQFGPASGELMKQWVGEGRITDDSYIWQEGWEDWKVAGNVIVGLPKSPSDSVESPFASGSVSGISRHTAAYKRERRRRTMLGVIGLLIGSVAVVALIVTLLFVINQMQ